MDPTFEELVDAALAAKNAPEPDMESYNILMEMASEMEASPQIPERQSWVADWLGKPQTLFSEPQSLGDLAVDTAASAASGVARGAQGILETPEFLAKGAGRVGQEIKHGFGNVPTESAIDPFTTKTGAGADYLVDKAGLTDARDYRGEGRLPAIAGAGGEFAIAGASKAPKTLAKNAAKMFGFGAAGEVAGQALDPTGYGDAARIGTGLLAPSATSAVRRPIRPVDGQNLKDTRLLQGRGVEVGLSDIMGKKPAEGVNIGAEKGKDFTRAVLESIGIKPGTTISSFVDDVPVLVTARQAQLNSEMEEVTKGIAVRFNGGEQRKISSITDTFKDRKGLSADVDEPNILIRRLKKRFLNVRQPITRDSYKSMRSDLSLLTKNKNTAVSSAANEMLQVLDEAVERTLRKSGKGDQVGILAGNRAKLRDIYAVVESLEGTTTNIIDPSALNQSLKKQNANQMFKGKRGDLGELAGAGDRLIPDVKPPVESGSLGSQLHDLARKTSPWTMMGGGAVTMLTQSEFASYIAPVMIAAGVSAATFQKLAKTDRGQKALINRALRSDKGQLGEDKIRAVVATAASQTIAEEEQ